MQNTSTESKISTPSRAAANQNDSAAGKSMPAVAIPQQQTNADETAQLEQAPVQRKEDEEHTLQAKLDPQQQKPFQFYKQSSLLSPVAERTVHKPFTVQQKTVQKAREGGPLTPFQLKTGRDSEPVQKRENKTGLPDQLKSGIENLSGFAMDDVKVNYNSDKPAQLQAHAYAQGSDIHIAPGQEKHLPHEAWHVVQQKQGRVQPTIQMKGGVNVNDDAGLENEADAMGSKATGFAGNNTANHEPKKADRNVSQLNSAVVQRAAGDALTVNGQAAFDILNEYFDGTRTADEVTAAFVPVAHDTNVNFVAICADVRQGYHSSFFRKSGVRTKARNLTAELAAGVLERRDHVANAHAGHALGRHGPDVSDNHLKHRLTTGYAPDGVLSPAPGLSSRFSSYQEYLATRQAAVNLAVTARTGTQVALNYYLTVYLNAHIAFLETPAGAGRGVAGGLRNTARDAVATQAATIANPNTTRLQATIVNPALPNAFANPVLAPAMLIAQTLINNMVQCRQTYQIVIEHGHDVGVSFQGTGVGAGNIFPGTAPAAAPTRTRTTFGVPGGAQPMQAMPNPATWTAIQHFPTTDAAGISF